MTTKKAALNSAILSLTPLFHEYDEKQILHMVFEYLHGFETLKIPIGSMDYKSWYMKRLQLAEKWNPSDDSEDKRLVHGTLVNQLCILKPIGVAILADNVSYVKQNLNDLDYENCLNMSCLFGSKQVALLFMGLLGINKVTSNLFSAICESFNDEWIRELYETQFRGKIFLWGENIAIARAMKQGGIAPSTPF